MVIHYSESELIARWVEFFQKKGDTYYYYPEILRVATLHPDERSVYVEYSHVAHFDSDLIDYFLENPQNAIYAAEKAMESILPGDLANRPLHFRLWKLPKSDTLKLTRIQIRDIRKIHLGRFVSIEGLVKKATEVRPRIVVATFVCQRCGAVVRQPQEDGIIIREPLECFKDQGGCGKAGNQTQFKLLTDQSMFTKNQGFNIDPSRLSEFVDTQSIEVQELPENLRGGEQPQRLYISFEDDLAGRVNPGERVIINGIVKSRYRERGSQKLTIFDEYLYANSVEGVQDKYEGVVITKEEEEQIIALSSNPRIYEMLVDSIAPTIYGMSTEKLALALQIFGGTTKVLPDGSRIRGDIHILFVGDPGTGKSQLLRFMAELSPRGIFTSGKTASAAGLTAAAVPDTTIGDGRWTLEAGALVLADQGIACIDEIDKMDAKDRSSMHEAMEQQSISVSKAGIMATLPSRCSILAAANPKYGRFDEYSSIAQQINLMPSLLSRFDAIFPVSDKPDPRWDSQLARHIITTHQIGAVEMLKKRLESGEVQTTPVIISDGRIEKRTPAISKELLKKYVSYAKKNVIPVMTEDAKQMLVEFYVNVRKSGKENATVPMTARQIEAFVRLSEASARVRLSDEVTVEDVKRAISIIEYYLHKVASEDGKLDIDIINTGTSSSQRTRMVVITNIISDLSSTGKAASEEDIIAHAARQNIPEDVVKETLRKLREEGRIYSPSHGTYKVIQMT
ncbi:MAG: minichromosome maintenance protein MCM [Thermoplasmata archaeon]